MWEWRSQHKCGITMEPAQVRMLLWEDLFFFLRTECLYVALPGLL